MVQLKYNSNGRDFTQYTVKIMTKDISRKKMF